MSLKYYDIENKAYERAYKTRITDKEAVELFQRMKIKFRLTKLKLKFWGNHRGGYYSDSRKIISICHNPNVLLLCHEIGHYLHRRKYPKAKRDHDNKLLKLVGKLVDYCGYSGKIEYDEIIIDNPNEE